MNKANACVLWNETCQTLIGTDEYGNEFSRDNYLAGAARALDVPVVLSTETGNKQDQVASFLRSWADALDPPREAE